MRWLLTNANLDLMAALMAAGETVIEGPYQADAPDFGWLRRARTTPGLPPNVDPVTWALMKSTEPIEDREVKDYRFRAVLDRGGFDVLVITPLLQPTLGFARGPLAKWKNRVGRKGIVVGIAQDPATMKAAQGHQWRSCSVRPEHCDVYVTDNASEARRQATQRRTALWDRGSATPIVEAVRHAMTSNYMTGRRAKPWA